MMQLRRDRLTTTQRRALYDSAVEAAKAAGREHPSCNLCPHPIMPGQKWEASHDAQRPRWLCNEAPSEIAHIRCNRLWNNQHDTPLYAKSNRQRDKFRDIKRSSNPLPGGRNDSLKRMVDGTVVARCPDDRTPAGTLAVSPEPNLTSSTCERWGS